MKKYKKGFHSLLAVLTIATIIGLLIPACSLKTVPKEKPKTTLKEVTLRIFLPGNNKAGTKMVAENLYHLTKDKLNARFEINFVSSGDYVNKLMMMAASGDNYDACFTADWKGYSLMINKGAFLDLTRLMPKYAPNLYQLYKKNNMLTSAMVGKNIMALPWTELKTSKPVFVYRKDISDKLGVVPTKPTDLDGIDSFLTAIAKKKPGIPVFDMAISGSGSHGDIISLLEAKYQYQFTGFHNFYIDLRAKEPKFIPLEQTPMFVEAVKLAKKWYDSGVISKDALSNKSASEFQNGKVFSGKTTASALFERIPFADPGAVKAAAEIYPGKLFARDSQMNNAMAINKNAENPERMLMFLDLLTTDRTVYDALMYGIQGKTYTLSNNGVVGFTNEDDPARALWQGFSGWGFYRSHFARPSVLRSADAIKAELNYALRPNIIVSSITGFVPISEKMKTECAMRDQLFDESGKILLAGLVSGNVDAAIADFIQKNKAAGLDGIQAEVQKQLKDYLKNKK